MSRIVKLSAAVIGALVALLIAGALLVAWSFDPNDYKDRLEAWASQQTGRELTIREDLALAFFPWLAVETGGITLGNAPGFDAEPFATVEHAAARVRLLPLLSRRVEIGTVVLEGLTLNLARDEQSRDNWADLLALAETDADAVAPAAPADDGAAWLEQVEIAGVTIRDGRLTWREDTTELRYVVSRLALEAGPLAPGAPADVELKLHFLDVAAGQGIELSAQTSARIDAAGTAVLDDLELRFRLEDADGTEQLGGRLQAATLQATAAGAVTAGRTDIEARMAPATPGSAALDVEAGWDTLRFDADAQTLAIDRLTTSAAGLETRWQLSGGSVLDAPAFEGRLELSTASLAGVLERLAVELPETLVAGNLGGLELSTTFRASIEPQQLTLSNLDARWLGMRLTADASLDGVEHLEADVRVPEFDPREGLLTLLAPYLPAGIEPAAFERVGFSGRLDADLTSGRATFAALEAALLGATFEGELDVVPGAGGSTYRGTLRSSRFAAGPLARALGDLLADGLTAESIGTLALDAGFGYDSSADTLVLEPLAAEAFGLRGSGRVTAHAVTSSPALSGRLELAAFSPRDLLRRFDQPVPETSDPAALSRAALQTQFDIDADGGRFSELALTLDDTRIGGDFAVESFESPSYRFTLAIDRVDVDRYLPPPAEQAAPGEMTAGAIELPADALNALRLDGAVEVTELALAGLDFSGVATRIAVGDGSARLDQARAQLYGGAFEGGLGVETGTAPSLSLTGRASSLTLAPLIEALTGEPANFSGTGSFDLALSGRGPTVIDNVRSASGTLGFAMRDGAIDGFNLGRALCAAYNLTQRLPQPAAAPAETRFETIQGTATVAGGVATSSDLLARAAFMDVTGNGRLELAEQRLDYQLEAALTAAIPIDGCQTTASLTGDSIPVRIRGTVTDPEITPDFSALIERRIREEVQDRVTDRLRERLEELLR